jgi:hypothetical protein
MRLIQIARPGQRRVGVAEQDAIRLVGAHLSVHSLAHTAYISRCPLSELVRVSLCPETLDYGQIYRGESEWRLLPPIDHPSEPARCIVTGTGLTHSSSARSRQAMHAPGDELTDSMRIYRWGLEGGRPAPGATGAAPEWFYKGTGAVLAAHLDPLEIPAFAEDGGEEAEIAGVYWIDPDGAPRRLGMAQGNEFSDHLFEKRNYLYLAASKLRTCSIGPELWLDPDFTSVPGRAWIERGGEIVWAKEIRSGEQAMCHSLANLEHHHFKFPLHRRPGDVHVHFYGADALSFSDGVTLSHGDVMAVEFEGFGRPLRNPVSVAARPDSPVRALPL